MDILARMAKLLLGILPNRCLLCHQQVLGDLSGVCEYCLKATVYQQPTCLGCGKTMVQQLEYCGACTKAMPLKVVAPCSYHSHLGPLIAGLKYRQEFAIVPPLVRALCERIDKLVVAQQIVLPQVLVPVPLHHNRLRSRGFNQAWIIAKEVSKQIHLPVVADVLSRTLDTPAQAGLSGKQRRRNLTGAFALPIDFPYQRIALIDDVVTTGTTVAEISRLFQRQGVHVQVWCLARAEAPNL